MSTDEAEVTSADDPRAGGTHCRAWRRHDPILVANGVSADSAASSRSTSSHAAIERNRITALIGPNGAGKTTFFNLLTGFDSPTSGTWNFDGRDLEGVAAHKVAKMGMVRTFQLTKALSRLTVIENMRLGATQQRGESIWAGPFKWLWTKQEDEITAACGLVARTVQARPHA